MRKIHVELCERGYDITVGRGIIAEAKNIFNLDRKVMIVTDEGVPCEYSRAVAKQCKEAFVFTLPEGDKSKCFGCLERVLSAMLDFGMTRGDCIVAVGGGVVGDLSGFCAATYMRGIDFYNLPTTLLSQVDSSIGGKTAINLNGVKNSVGVFYQPKAVLIDVDTLKTLSARHFSAGMCEAIKMAATFDKELFEFIESNGKDENALEEIISRALLIKKRVVEEDEKESGLRKVLNFGHTFGHCVEAAEELSGLYHGECVAIGMMPMCGDGIKPRMDRLLKDFNLPTVYTGDIDRALEYVTHDKKRTNNLVSCIFVDEIGKFRMEKITTDDFKKLIKENAI